MTPRLEQDVIGRHGTVYSRDEIGPEANMSHEAIVEQQREAMLSEVRGMVIDDIETHGFVAMADMRFTLDRASDAYERLDSPLFHLTFEEVTAEYLSALTLRLVDKKQHEVSDDELDEYFTGLSQVLPELAKAA